MKVANIAEFKNRLSELLSAVENGEEIEVRKRNVPIARVIPIEKKKKNRSVPGCGKGTGVILGDITGPLIPEEDWEMLKDDEE
jgi:prevent-host-death family protein